jgi:hypothetical protein
MQGVTTAAFLLTSYARSLAKAQATVTCGNKQIKPSQLIKLAQKQVLVLNFFTISAVLQASFSLFFINCLTKMKIS